MPEMKYRDALRCALREELAHDPAVFLMGEDIGIYGGAYAVTRGLYKEFGPERVMDTPISEAVIVGAAVGAAAIGARPVVEIMYVDFMTLCMDQVVNQAAKIRYMFGGKIKVPIVIRTQEGTGSNCAAQHSQSLESWFIHVPGLKVVMPATPRDAKGLLKSAIRDDNVVIFIEHKLLYNTTGDVPEGELIPLGLAEVKRAGKDVTIIAWSRMLLFALEAAVKLSQEGIEAEVVDPRTLQPLDTDTILRSVEKTGRAVVVEEDCRTGGVGTEISARICENMFHRLKGPIVRVAGRDVPIPFSPILEQAVVPDVQSIMKAARNLCMGVMVD